MARKELEAILNFILNEAEDAEFEVIVKACQRRQKDSHFFARTGSPNPNVAARKMAEQLSKNVGADMESVKGLVRGYVEDIIRKNAPGIPDGDLEVLMEHYLPPEEAKKERAESPLPPEALLTMIQEFMSYSTGVMPPSEQQQLWEEMPRWQEIYWKAFPPEVRALVDGVLKGKIQMEQFWPAIRGLLEI